MAVKNTTFIGVDPSGGVRSMYYAALDRDLSPIALGKGDMEKVLAYVSQHAEVVLAINAPQSPNQGLVQEREANISKWHDFRLAEYELWQRNIRTYHTPAIEADCKPWMQRGFKIYQRLQGLGFGTHLDSKSQNQVLEAPAHASFCALLERRPFPRRSLEGRLQRQILLYEVGLDIHDPLRYFEEITRYRLRHGELPAKGLYTPAELDALILAYTAWLAANRPRRVQRVGAVGEGQMVVPAAVLKEKY